MTATKANPTETALDHEAVVIGAGVCGIYQLYRLRELGIDATVLESGKELGGTWFWNRYPGARFDSESYTYGFSFSDELLAEWDWKERFSSQPENLRYLQYVADKFGLRDDMQFGVTVESAEYDDTSRTWRLQLEDGRSLTTRWLILAVGLLSAPTLPTYAGMADFAGESFHTYDWPESGVELAGKRVGVIGTGATAIQLIPVVAEQAAELTVFQRRPNWTAPLHNSCGRGRVRADCRRGRLSLPCRPDRDGSTRRRSTVSRAGSPATSGFSHSPTTTCRRGRPSCPTAPDRRTPRSRWCRHWRPSSTVFPTANVRG